MTKTGSSTVVLVVELETGVVDSVFVVSSFLMKGDGVQVLIILVAATGIIMEAIEKIMVHLKMLINIELGGNYSNS